MRVVHYLCLSPTGYLSMRRHFVAIMALACLIGSAVFVATQGWDAAQKSVVFSGLLRAGLTLAAMWLAYPQVAALARRLSPLWVSIALVTLVLIMVRPRSLLYLGPLLLIVGALAWLQRFLRQP